MKAVNPCGLKRAALINDLSCFGKCSLSVSMPILSSYGIETVPLPTALLSTHTGGFTCYVVQDTTEAMRELCSLADVITPNRTEAALLSGLACSSADETLLYAQQVKNTILTSVRTETGIGYLARLDGGIRLVLRPFVELTLHGAGDVFTSALCGELLCGKAPMDALDSAADFCDRCIHETVKRQPWHWYGLAFEPVLKGNHV